MWYTHLDQSSNPVHNLVQQLEMLYSVKQWLVVLYMHLSSIPAYAIEIVLL